MKHKRPQMIPLARLLRENFTPAQRKRIKAKADAILTRLRKKAASTRTQREGVR